MPSTRGPSAIKPNAYLSPTVASERARRSAAEGKAAKLQDIGKKLLASPVAAAIEDPEFQDLMNQLRTILPE